MRAGRYVAGMLESPVTWVLAGAALAVLAVPSLRRTMRPAMVGTMRGAYRMGNDLRDRVMGTMMELGEILGEARETVQQRAQRMNVQGTMNAAISAGAGAAGRMGEAVRDAGRTVTSRAMEIGEEIAGGAEQVGKRMARGTNQAAEEFTEKLESHRSRHRQL